LIVGRPRKVDPNATAVADPPATRKPRVNVLERRLQNPFGEPSAPVRLKESGLIARWFNSGVRPEQFWRAQQLGWQGVTPNMVVDLAQIGFYTTSVEGYVARGERAQEILMFMPEDDYRRIQVAKTEKNLKDMRDFDREKHNALNAFAAQGGNADLVEANITPVGGVTTQIERVERMPDEQEPTA
jgi:hypothetical protein